MIISREEIMKSSKISSIATYHKCIKELERLGYLEYNPSFNPYSGTSITVRDFTLNSKSKPENTPRTCSINEQVQNRTIPKNEQLIEQVNEQPYIYNNKTYTNNKNIDRYKNENLDVLNTCSNFDKVKERKNEKEKSSAKKEKDTAEKLSGKNKPELFPSGEEKPNLKLVKEYFLFQKNTEFEAERFFNYYTSNGWLIGGKTKMEDWKAAARNWMLNTAKFSVNFPKNTTAKENDRAQNLHTETDKNYSEPL